MVEIVVCEEYSMAGIVVVVAVAAGTGMPAAVTIAAAVLGMRVCV